MKDFTTRKKHLLQLGEQAADELADFVKLKDRLPQGNNADYSAEVFLKSKKEADDIKGRFDGLLDRLEEIAAHWSEVDVENDYVQALGTYLCDVRNTISCFSRNCLLFSKFESSSKIKGFFGMARAIREFNKSEKKYLKSGIEIKVLWSVYKRVDQDGVINCESLRSST